MKFDVPKEGESVLISDWMTPAVTGRIMSVRSVEVFRSGHAEFDVELAAVNGDPTNPFKTLPSPIEERAKAVIRRERRGDTWIWIIVNPQAPRSVDD